MLKHESPVSRACRCSIGQRIPSTSVFRSASLVIASEGDRAQALCATVKAAVSGAVDRLTTKGKVAHSGKLECSVVEIAATTGALFTLSPLDHLTGLRLCDHY